MPVAQHAHILTLRSSVHEHLRYQASKEEAKQAQRKPEVGPIMSILHNLQGITFEVYRAIKVHFMKRLHGDLALAMVFYPILLTVKL